MLTDKALMIIAKWIKANEKLKQINQYLYENTELFEERYESDYRNQLFSFFAGKICRFSKDYNKLMELITQKEKEKIEYIRLLED